MLDAQNLLDSRLSLGMVLAVKLFIFWL